MTARPPRRRHPVAEPVVAFVATSSTGSACRRRHRQPTRCSDGHRDPTAQPRPAAGRAALIMVFILSVTMLLQLTVIGGSQQSAAQERKFDEFRSQLATGTAPIGPTDNQNRALGDRCADRLPRDPRDRVASGGRRGHHVERAVLRVPGTGATRCCPGQVGVQHHHGTRRGVRRSVRGHRPARGRRRDPRDHRPGRVRVRGDRRAPGGRSGSCTRGAGSSRLVLATADGRPYLPEGVLRVDADLVGTAVGRPGACIQRGDAARRPNSSWARTPRRCGRSRCGSRC